MDKYFISGKNFFIDTELAKILSSKKDAEIERFFGDELNKDDFFSFINSPSMFGAEKIAYIRNSEKITDFIPLLNSIKRCKETILIFSSSEQKANIDKKFKELDSKLKELNFILITENISKGHAPTSSDIIDIFKSVGLNINQSTANEILGLTSNDLQLAKNEAEKFSLYLATNKDKNISELLDNLSGNKLESIYTLIDRFAEKRSDISLKLLKNIPLNENKNDYQIFYGLAKRITNIYFAFISPLLINEYQDFAKRKVNDNKKFWTRLDAGKMIEKCSLLDLDIKTGKITFSDAILNLLTTVKS